MRCAKSIGAGLCGDFFDCESGVGIDGEDGAGAVILCGVLPRIAIIASAEGRWLNGILISGGVSDVFAGAKRARSFEHEAQRAVPTGVQESQCPQTMPIS